MTKAKQRSIQVSVSLAAAASVAGLVVYYAALGEEPAPPPTEEARATHAVLVRIQSESR